jgi:hypothetical protein
MRRIIFIYFLFSINCLFAQYSYKFQNPKTPEVYQIEKYGNPDISLYTGTPNINIPLYNIKYGQIEVPLQISYNSNGIRGDEEASSIGLGWNFSIPVITQTVNGYDDLTIPNLRMKYYYNYKAFDLVDPQPKWYIDYRHSSDIILKSGDTPLRIYNSNTMITDPTLHLNEGFMGKLRSEGGVGGFFSQTTTFLPYTYQNNPLYKAHFYYSGTHPAYGLDFDMELDFFRASFYGHNITFYKYPNQDVFFVLNKKGYKIDFERNEAIKKYKWKITTPDGKLYTFDYQKISISENTQSEYQTRTNYKINVNTHSTPSYGLVNGMQTPTQTLVKSLTGRTWNISSIEDINGNKVDFIYKQLPSVNAYSEYSNGTCNFLNTIFTQTVMGYNPQDIILLDNYVDPSSVPASNGSSIQCNKSPSSISYENNILDKIKFGENEVRFYTSNRIDKIYDAKYDSITVKNYNSTVHKIEFSHSYYPENHVLSKRMKLDFIRINESKYKFDYNNENLPTKGTDYWGFLNGLSYETPYTNPFRFYNSVSDIPSWANDLFQQTKDTENKSAHPENIKVGMLRKVTYPTGGYSIFEYELNTFDNYFFPNYDNKITVNGIYKDYPQNYSSGFGLRVKNTIDYDFNNTLQKKSVFKYYGGKYIPPVSKMNEEDMFRVHSLEINSNVAPFNIFSVAWSNRIRTVNSSLFQTNILGNGDFVGYDKVEISKTDSGNNSLGKEVFHYSNIPDSKPTEVFGVLDGVSANEINAFGRGIRKSDVDNGSLLKKEVYNEGNIKVREVENQYDTRLLYDNISKTCYNVFVNKSGARVAAISSQPYIFYDVNLFFYPLKGSETLMKKMIERDYNNTGNLVNQTDFSYDQYHLPVTKTTLTSTNDQIQENTTYSHIIDRLKNKNILTNIIGKAFYKNNKQLPWTSVKYDDVSHYNPTSETTYELNSPNNNPTADVTYNKYDNKGNLLQYTTKAGIPTSIIWGYSQTQPIAKIEGAQYSDVQNLATDIINASNTDNAATPGNDETLFLEKLDAFRKKSELINYQITTYTYDPLIGIRSITSPTGLRNVYIYDNENRLKEIRENDINGKIVKEYQYNFAPMRYYNTTKSQSFYKANCSGIPSSYLYTVPSDTYYSNISQADADQQAQNDINSNGQNAANNNGICTPMSCNLSFNSSIGINGGGGIGIINNSTPHFKLTFGMSTGSNSINLPWNTGVKIGTINGNCRPANDYSSYNGSIYYTVKTNGDVILKTLGSPFPNNTSYNYEFIYPIN